MNSRTATLRKLLAGSLTLAALALPAGASAMHAAGPSPWAAGGEAGPLSWSIEPSAGMAFGKAYEKVYDGSYKLSELNWDLDGVGVAGATGSLTFAGRVQVNVGFWTAVTEGDGRMVDWDWIYAPYSYGEAMGFPQPADIADDDWTHESRHDASVDSGTMFDLNLTVRALDLGPVSVSGVVGYFSDEWEWSSRNGSLIYSVDANDNGFLDYPGEFRNLRRPPVDDELDIGYRQKYSAPYVGVACDAAWSAVRLQAYLRYSPWVSAEDEDFHARRDILFLGDFSDGSFIGAGAKATLFISGGFFAAVSFDWQQFDEIVGDVTIEAPGGSGVDEDGGSAELGVVSVLASAGYRF